MPNRNEIAEDYMSQASAHKSKSFLTNPTTLIILSAISAVLIGILIQATVHQVPSVVLHIVSVPGKLWLQGLQACVIPLVFVSIVQSVQSMKSLNSQQAKQIVKIALLFYAFTTIIAVIEGTLLGSLWVAPNLSNGTVPIRDQSQPTTDQIPRVLKPIDQQIEDIVLGFIPSNVFSAFANDQLLAIIITAMTIGYLIQDPNTSVIFKLVDELEKMVVIVVAMLIRLSPFGVFFLVVSSVIKTELFSLGRYFVYLVLANASAMLFHFFVIYPLIYIVLVRQSPWKHIVGTLPAVWTGLGCSSSAAALPIAFKCCKNLQYGNTVRQFLLPLGATVNMDGAAIYFPISVIFLAATQGIALGVSDYIMIGLLSALASVGASPIPSAGLPFIIMISQQFKVEITSMFSVIVAMDWLVDRLATALDISGNLYAVAIVSNLTGIVDQDETEVEIYF